MGPLQNLSDFTKKPRKPSAGSSFCAPLPQAAMHELKVAVVALTRPQLLVVSTLRWIETAKKD